MGTWGSGILQNDQAADSVLDAAKAVEDALRGLVVGPVGSDSAGRMLGAVGLLMRFSPYSFDLENDVRAPLVEAVGRQIPALPEVSAEARAALDALLAGREPDYRMTTFPPRLARALFGSNERSQFPMEGTWADAPEGVFELPAARALAQEVADGCVAAIDEDFEHEQSLEDPCRESEAMGRLALLLVLDGIRVDPSCFVGWRDAWRRGRREPVPSEVAFFQKYDACLEAAIAYGIERFSP
ncbi:MAG: hypothetical protein KF901_29535 [Myxococcales bacterium]|nr:hypothetical protein [Myxococcales bacterium]